MSKQNGQREAMEHDTAMQLHQANQQQALRGSSPEGQARLLDKMVDSELESTDESLSNLRAKDFPLSNYDDEGVDTTEFKWMQEIMHILSKARHPHPGSGLQGLSRAWAMNDTTDRRQSLELDEVASDEAYLLGTFSRAKRGEDMAQQETSAKQVTESRAIHEEGGSSGGGGILGRWRD